MQKKSPQPSPWVIRFLDGVPREGHLLDVACGSGRHLNAAVRRRLRATGVDRDISRARELAALPGVELLEFDLQSGAELPFQPGRFDAVVVTNYLWRPILPDIVAAVASRGLLIYETFAKGNERFGRPSNPNFLLRPGELLDCVRSRLVPVCFEHLRLVDPDRVVQRICAVGPDHEWLNTPPTL
jgi:SAM-dependent methyltransferase